MARSAPMAAVMLLALFVCAAMAQEQPAATAQPLPRKPEVLATDCSGKCGRTYLPDGTGGVCHCDYYCNNMAGGCCGGTASKNQLCPELVPTLVKPQITNCDLFSKAASPRTNFAPGQCWCDAPICTRAGDCCATCATCRAEQAPKKAQEAEAAIASAAEVAEVEGGLSPEALAASPLWQRIQAQVEAATASRRHEHHDCGAPHSVHELSAAIARRPGAVSPMANADINAVATSLEAAEIQMQACQAADQGPPATPIQVPIHWTAGQVCDGTGACVGGTYSKALVQRQIDLTNAVFAHVGITFVWDGVIHKATAGDAFDIDVGYGPGDWICSQKRYGDALAVNVMTSPIHPGGSALGVTLYPSYFSTGQLPQCANWVFIFEKTLPDQGGRSKIDGLLCDGGATLTHEIGHQMMLAHTWNQLGGGSVASQCTASASLEPRMIVDGYSDGVRDTVAQSLNGTNNPVTNILRFVACDPVTGAYTNTTAFAQQSCHSGTGYAAGDGYYNNYNNLMSYGDRYCLRTFTPGQGARARCAIKCLRLGQC